MSEPHIDPKTRILGELHAHLSAKVRRRRIARSAASGACFLALCAAVYFAIPSAPPLPSGSGSTPIVRADPSPTNQEAGPAVAPNAHDPIPVAAASPRVTVRIARSEPVPTTPCETAAAATVCILSDEQLLAALAEAGRPAGLIRTGGTAYVVPIGSTQPLR